MGAEFLLLEEQPEGYYGLYVNHYYIRIDNNEWRK
ncbi:hypothetical protein SRABI96_00024 [Peribacillus sp. Bi96]|nr:hypothetical protein SRABI96_00024 [Peribacillus sp. Bi96]